LTRSPGAPRVACALSRAFSLRRDPLAEAALRSRSHRVHLIDMTHYFCGAQLCYPVVGGALVHKDTNQRLKRLVPGD
jgi:hypothetical protein